MNKNEWKEKVIEMLDLRAPIYGGRGGKGIDAVSDILTLMCDFAEKEIIGEDAEEPINVEHPDYEFFVHETAVKNELKKEQRQRIAEWREKNI